MAALGSRGLPSPRAPTPSRNGRRHAPRPPRRSAPLCPVSRTGTVGQRLGGSTSLLKQSVPTRRPAGQLLSTPRPALRLARPTSDSRPRAKFSRLFSVKQRVTSRVPSHGRPARARLSNDLGHLTLDLGPWTLSCPVPICPVP